MKKHHHLFKICMILLLFGTARVQAFSDSEECEYGKIEDGSCQKNVEKSINELDEPHIHKSLFSESHDCDLKENIATSDSNVYHDSCPQREQVDDQSELSMLEGQTKRDDGDKSVVSADEEPSEFAGKHLGDDVEDKEVETDTQSLVMDEMQSSSEETSQSESSSFLENEVEIPEESNKNHQDPEMGNVPLREILLKLKPEGLTDNEDDQPSDFSVTGGSIDEEEEEVGEETLVSSGSAEKQDSSVDNSSDSGKNGSGSGSVSKKAVCSEVTVTDDPQKDVEIINASMLMKLLQGNPNITNRSSAAPCHLIYFFSPYCPFSVAGSPYVNAMARSLKNIPVYGLDSIEHHSVNARYGVTGTPTLLLFHNGNGVGRYNASEYSVRHLKSFINHYTDQCIVHINVTSADFKATLPSEIAEGRPYALWASWIFLLSCAAWLFLTSDLCARLTEAILNNWREAEAQNDQD